MAIERTRALAVHKPWGSTDLQPWSDIHGNGDAIGEVWFRRADNSASPPALLLKLLFTEEALSIQVHPDDAFARSIGLANGKTEAWYILSALPGSQVALGLKDRMSSGALRAAICDGSIRELVRWRDVAKDDIVVVPAGTIHAIGAGLVVAEIQQESDTTFRLFDQGRSRPLHIEEAVAAARPEPANAQPAAWRLDDSRTVLVAGPCFVLERIALAPYTNWTMLAAQETWVLVIDGDARIGAASARRGDAFFHESGSAVIAAGSSGMTALTAYVGSVPRHGLLRLQPEGMAAPLLPKSRPSHPRPEVMASGPRHNAVRYE